MYVCMYVCMCRFKVSQFPHLSNAAPSNSSYIEQVNALTASAQSNESKAIVSDVHRYIFMCIHVYVLFYVCMYA